MKQRSWDVWLGNKVVDTVFYDARDTAEDVKRSLVEHDGYYPEIVVMEPGVTPTYPGDIRPRRALWSKRYELARHGHSCWFNPTQRRWVYQSKNSGDLIVCDDWMRHPGRRGSPGYLRFIRLFDDQLHNTVLLNPFVSRQRTRDGDITKDNPLGVDTCEETTLWIAHEGMQTEDGLLVYCEVYGIVTDHWGFNPVFRVFLNGTDGWSQIECYDERYVGPALSADAALTQQYIDEEENSQP